MVLRIQEWNSFNEVKKLSCPEVAITQGSQEQTTGKVLFISIIPDR